MTKNRRYIIHTPGSTIMRGFQYGYPQSFLDKLAKDLGIKWIKVKWRTVPEGKISVHPLPPPTGKLLYIEDKYKDDKE